MLEIDDNAPSFCLPNQDKEEICLRDLAGKWVVLYFYPRDNTPGCTTEACDFTNSIDEFEELDAIVLGVSPDTPKKHRNFIDKKELKVTLLADEDKSVAQDYGVWQLKKFMGRESMGIVRSTFIISPDGKISALWRKVRVKGHINSVKDKLEELTKN
ncbi:Thiol peroxidase, Bcp-type [hydrothermal vent metagenome]|uniref:thioredoxin-dependent peroxiredoxin n=1 Tax=hydrothermal vent metagenome TaxID=652676 RepID=A0A1W1EKQ2_9ZZZZ